KYTIQALDWVDLSHETPKLAAQLLRQAWGLGIGPAPNMVQLCESRGISVYGLTTIAKSVDASSAWIGTRPLIFTSRQKGPNPALSTTCMRSETESCTTIPQEETTLNKSEKPTPSRQSFSSIRQHSRLISLNCPTSHRSSTSRPYIECRYYPQQLHYTACIFSVTPPIS